jgi:streptogramin lyase
VRVRLALPVVTAALVLSFVPAAAADFGFITQWGTFGTGDGQFNGSTSGIEVDPSGDVLVADSGNQRVERFTNNGVYLRQWQTTTSAGLGIAPDGHVYVANLFSTPEVDIYGTVGESLGLFKTFPENLYSVTVDNSGNVIVFTGSGVPGQIIKKFDSAGNLLTQWGTYGNADGQLSSAGAYDVAADSAGNLYVSDPGNVRISKFDVNGTFITKWGSSGPGDGQFGVIGPRGLTVDRNDNVWVSDPSNGRVQLFNPSGQLVQQFGTLGNGPGQFDRPTDVATDSAGNVFVMDGSNFRVVKLGERPEPVLGKAMGAEPVSGTVLVRLPRTNTFVPLTAGLALPVGTIVDARKGRVRITATSGGKTFSADFFQGQFQLAQRLKNGATADIKLFGGTFKRCPAGLRSPKSLGSKAPKSVRKLWGEGSGPFRTVGRFSAASVRGTTWLTDDQCPGTLTRVTAGSVLVRDFVRRKTVLVNAGRSYLARSRR